MVRGLTGALGRCEGVEPVTWVPAPERDGEQDWPVAIRRFSCLGPPRHCLAPELAGQYIADGTDIVHTHGLWTFLARTDLAWRAKSGRPYLITLHGMTMPAALAYARVKKFFFWRMYERRHLREAACLHALSEAEAASVARLGIRTPVCIVPNGVHVPSETGREQRANPARHPVLLYLGRLHPIKGLEELLKAWHQVRSASGEAREWRLVLAGWGEGAYPGRLKELSAALGLENSVHFAGPVFGEEKERLLRESDGFVLPSRSEAFPMALLEAWAAGLPCLATDPCRVADDRNEPACIYVPASEEGLREGLQGLLSMSAARRVALGDRARLLAQREYAWPVVAARFSAVYSWMAEGGGMPDWVRHGT